MKLCSACLLGVRCSYKGSDKVNDKVVELAKKKYFLPICPEQLGGLPTPRPATEIKNGRIITKEGEDQTEGYLKGVEETLKLCQILGIKEAVLKQYSPTCGCGKIFDGSFSGKVIKGDGILTKLLKSKGIKVISEDDL